MSGRKWLVYWDEIDDVWRAESRSWWDTSREVPEGHPSWREAFDYADRMARADR